MTVCLVFYAKGITAPSAEDLRRRAVLDLLVLVGLCQSVLVLTTCIQQASHTVRPRQKSCDDLQYLELFRVCTVKRQKMEEMIADKLSTATHYYEGLVE